MFNELNRKIADLTARMECVFKLEGRLDQLEKERVRFTGRIMKLKKKLARENGDVERLEKPGFFGFFGFFRFFSGGKETRLRKEKQEADSARRKVDEVQERLAPVEAEIETVRTELEGLASLGEEYAAVMAEKEKAILDLGGKNAGKLAELVAGEESARSAYELHDACFDKATDISIFLARASAALRDAGSWGKADLVMGGSLYTWSEKHVAVDKARELVKEAQKSLRELNRIIRNANDRIRIPTVAMDTLLKISDLFFSNPIIDLMVLKRITTTARNVQSTHRTFKQILPTLRVAGKKAAAKLNRTRAERREFVEKLE